MTQENQPAPAGDADVRDEWTCGALYGAAMACRLDAPHVAEELLRAMGIRTRADLAVVGADVQDTEPLRRLLPLATRRRAAVKP